MGEGWHNYHHVFPWDYKAAELGKYSVNATTFILDSFHKIGWCWDMKEPSKDLVKRVYEKYGDGTHEHLQQSNPKTKGEAVHHTHLPEVPDPEYIKEKLKHDEEEESESSSTESATLDDLKDD